mmetsp:Transcript_27321/g.74738  ORF Transcript_27321/g.74738 Transcript_27321/m.74738 type:complete len:702 (+) Transcript_27321:258-2363(+)|eukprot:CAMPEP_0172360734 /NCGR_PEP_ID=MMETSP1060-20121228/4708_1 /TAXON_ID=37318 /ORGANISM="Pseudo-nitzschia pungens, Strain cf. cingulata" /LENGTH=701 /DNA_ID=CAMNT_0013082801 /DNA_START=189 /DNA_END=2294 /DNA_ORIENTATION=+
MRSTEDSNIGVGGPELPPGLSEMFINSTDSLRHREINQKIPETWNERPPLFAPCPNSKRRGFLWRKTTESAEDEDSDEKEHTENPNLLKGMIRKGIPPSLRCAVWLSNIIQSSRTNDDLSEIHKYRTLAKVRVVDNAYDSLWESVQNNRTSGRKSIAPSVSKISKDDVKVVDFGNESVWEKLDEEKCPGRDVVKQILFSLHHSVLGGIIDYAPLLPTLVTILSGFMSEPYVFYACREMYHHSAWFLATSRSEQIATQRAFLDVLGRLHPHTLTIMKEQGVDKQFTKEVFQNFFTNIFPERMVIRLMDIYSLEGSKVLFRFGVALAVLYGKEYKEHYKYVSAEPNKWWLGLVDYCHSGEESKGLNFEVLVKKAYGVHGKGVRKRFRFPRRPILTRIIEIEEEKYRQELKRRRDHELSGGSGGGDVICAEDSDYSDSYLDQIEPIGLMIRPRSSDFSERILPRLAASTFVRTKLAEWLPLSLRFTKLDLVYSTSHHGRTLENVYRCLAKSRHSICVIEPFEKKHSQYLIGMYASHTWHPSSRVYGDGRCFLFRIDLEDDKIGKNIQHDENNGTVDSELCSGGSKSWKWNPPDMLDFGVVGSFDNDNDDGQSNTIFPVLQQAASPRTTALVETFQVSTQNFLSLGGNEQGGAGLRLNEDLTKAESACADGFNNEPLLPGSGGMFEVGLVEVYQLVRQMDGVPVR